MATTDRYAQCDSTCTVDCGACKGAGRPTATEHRPRGRHFCSCGWEGDNIAVHQADVEAEMVTVPRALLAAIRCDLLLVCTDPDHPLAPDVERLAREDRAELLAYAPYRN